MRFPLLVAGLLLAVTLSGCLADLNDPEGGNGGLFSGKEKVVSKGDSLDSISFDDTGSIMSTVTQPDCADGGGSIETHQWQIPATNQDGYPWKASTLTVTVTKAATMPDIDLILRIGDQEIASAREMGPDDAATVSVSATDVPPGQLTIEVQACTTATGDYTLEGGADMVASADVYKDGSTGAVDSASPGGVGQVVVEQKTDSDGNTYWEASRQEVYTATLTGVTGTASLSTGAGAISYTGSSGTDHRLVASLKARGDSEQQARDRLAEMSVDHSADDGAVVMLEAHGRPGGDGSWNKKQIDLLSTTPEAIDWTTFTVSISAGAAYVENVHGTLLDLDTSAGQIEVKDTEADTLDARTSAGQILVTNSRAGDLVLRTSAGQVIASMRTSTQSGDWDLDASAGQIDLDVVENAELGYDVSATTAAGQVVFSFQDVEETESDCQYASCHREGRTNGYDSRPIKVVMDLDTSAGQILVGS